jgi:energy-coupling factor transporter ATP-binding protein EcfA2
MLRPEVLLLDEPCSGLDPISTAKIEEAMQGLKKSMSIVLVTNNVKQASRTSDRTAFLLMGAWWNWPKPGNFSPVPKEQKPRIMSPAGLGKAPMTRQRNGVRRFARHRNLGAQPFLRGFPGPQKHHPSDPSQNHHGVHRSLRVRQIHAAAHLQPNERPHPRRARGRGRSFSTAKIFWPPTRI